jgi:hypothetical protein
MDACAPAASVSSPISATRECANANVPACFTFGAPLASGAAADFGTYTAFRIQILDAAEQRRILAFGSRYSGCKNKVDARMARVGTLEGSNLFRQPRRPVTTAMMRSKGWL